MTPRRPIRRVAGSSDADQKPFRRDETTDHLTPRFFFALDEHSISSRFKLRRRGFDAINVKLQPGLRNRGDRDRPDLCAGAGDRELGVSRAHGRGPCWRSFRYKIGMLPVLAACAIAGFAIKAVAGVF
jgi:hypothetical protein